MNVYWLCSEFMNYSWFIKQFMNVYISWITCDNIHSRIIIYYSLSSEYNVLNYLPFSANQDNNYLPEDSLSSHSWVYFGSELLVSCVF